MIRILGRRILIVTQRRVRGNKTRRRCATLKFRNSVARKRVAKSPLSSVN